MSAATLDLRSKVRVLLEEVVQLAGAVLEGELDVVEAGVFQGFDAGFGEADA